MNENLYVQDKSIVVPGEVLATGMSYLPGSGTYRMGENILANRLGLIVIEGKVLKSVPLSGRYLPKINDVIIGRVIDILMSGWRLEINSPYTAVLPLKDASFSYIEKGADLTRFFELDDYVMVKITNVTSQNLVDVSAKGPGLNKLRGGRIVHVSASKVPRIIGKKGSMISMIKKATDCKISVGQNGLVWISGEPEMEILAVNTISLIEQKAHISGLTEFIKSHLGKLTGKTIDMDAIAKESEEQFAQEQQQESDTRERYDRPRPQGYGPRDRGFSRGRMYGKRSE